MPNDYTGSGGVNIGGCADYVVQIFYDFEFAERSIVFIRAKALKGKMEAVAIKKLILNVAGGQSYLDSNNGVWLENELCSESDAIDLASVALQAQIDKLGQSILTCSN